ncbi:MAG: hypothetical protein H7288_06285 [Kineosporiaceae bacterium]|nr:hypothetical protein [Aeromicrobium sp.]
MTRSNTAPTGGVGLPGLLFLLFLALKLTGHIDWSWWWVTAPLWIPVGILLGSLAVAAVVAGITAIILFANKR